MLIASVGLPRMALLLRHRAHASGCTSGEYSSSLVRFSHSRRNTLSGSVRAAVANAARVGPPGRPSDGHASYHVAGSSCGACGSAAHLNQPSPPPSSSSSLVSRLPTTAACPSARKCLSSTLAPVPALLSTMNWPSGFVASVG